MIVLLLAGCAPIQGPLDRRLLAVVQQPDAPLASLAVAAVQNGEITYAGYWGFRRIDAADPQMRAPVGAPVTSATKFRVASISKVVTALGAMLLVEQGRLQLDRDISAYLGFRLRNPHYPDRPITARMLLSHTSSLRDTNFYLVPLPYTIKDLFDPAGAYYANGAHFAAPQGSADTGSPNQGSPDPGPPDLGPGAYFTYANLNYGVLATVMEAAAGERFDRYIRRTLLAPLEIDGGYTLDGLDGSALAEVATLYTKQDGTGAWDPYGPWYAQYDQLSGAPPLPDTGPRLAPTPPSVQPPPDGSLRRYRLGSNATIFAPHAGLRISARDLAKIVLLFLDEGRYNGRQIVAPETLQRMLREQWRFDPQHPNGDTQGGLLRAWGLGLQHITADQVPAGEGGDCLTAECGEGFWGHRGEAYGFLGGLWFNPQRRIGFVYLIGGVGDDPLRHPGSYSAFTQWEEAIQSAVLREIGSDDTSPPVR